MGSLSTQAFVLGISPKTCNGGIAESGMSKIFEKLIMQRILEIKDIHNVDLTGTKQHGFKRKRSTSTAGINYSWLNESFDTFKVKCKKLLL